MILYIPFYLYYFNYSKMNPQTHLSMTLIYHDFRGMAQIIRYLFCYLQQPFNQILLKQGQRSSSLEILQRLSITEDVDLPCLIDGDVIIQDFFAILRHICKKFNRQDLLGQTTQQRTLIRQIYYNFMLKKKKEIKMMFQYSEKAAEFPQRKEQIRKAAMQLLHENSGSVIQMVKIRLRNLNNRYILGNFTVLDFLLFEESFYQINLFGNLEESNCPIYQAINSLIKTDYNSFKSLSSLYLKVMRQFKQSLEKEQFYLRNKQKLESYGLYCPVMKSYTKECFRKFWLGPEHFLK